MSNPHQGESGTRPVHPLKCWPFYFQAIEDGVKTFEVRVDDRGFETGDGLRIQEWDPITKEYTGREMLRRISYQANIHDLPVPIGDSRVVVLALAPLDAGSEKREPDDDWMNASPPRIAERTIEGVLREEPVRPLEWDLGASPVVPEPVAPLGRAEAHETRWSRLAVLAAQNQYSEEHEVRRTALRILDLMAEIEKAWPVGSSDTERRYTLEKVAEKLDEAAREDRAWHGEKLRIGYRNAAKWLRSAAAEEEK